MRRTILSAIALAATLLLPLAAHTPMAQGNAPAALSGPAFARVIVKYRVDSDLMMKQAMTGTGKRILQAQALGDRIGVPLTAGIGLSDRSHVVLARGLSSSSLAARIAAQKDVEYAVVDERKHIVGVPNDQLYASGRAISGSSGGPAVGQWYLKPPGTTGTPSSINAERAWDITTGSASIVVAVLDTGVRFDHVDFKTVAAGGNLLPGYDMIEADDGPGGTNFSTANDGNGRDPDASDPGDFVSAADKANNPIFAKCTVDPNSSWHGTQTLGLIGAATDNEIGIASVGRNVHVMPVRVLGKCGGYDSDIVVGMQWAANVYSDVELATLGLPRNPTPAKVLNMSLGGGITCGQMYVDAMTRITAANVVVVASAGNSAGHAVNSPANCPGVIAVSALRHVGDKVGFSDLGAEITISAPGGNCVNINGGPCLYPIMTTSNSGATAPVIGAAGAIYTDSFNASLGTSFSAPIVAGTIALMLSVQPTMTPAAVKATLQATARAFPTTGGTVNISTTTASPTASSPVTLAATEPSQCVAPTSGSPDQLECYCTTSTCGAGMLDAYAAVTAANGGGVIPPTSFPRRVVSYSWTLIDGGGIVTTLTGANTPFVSATPTGAGTFTVGLATTDDLGLVSITSSAVTVAAAPVVTPPPSSGGGGGALGAGWLLLLLTAVLALAAASRFKRRQPAPRGLSAPARLSRRR